MRTPWHRRSAIPQGVLDDIGRAREHGDLTGAFRSVGEAIEAATAKLGLERFGEPGDVFDLTVHEALMHEYSDEVTEPTCTRVLIPAIGSVTGLSGRPGGGGRTHRGTAEPRGGGRAGGG